MRGQRHAPAALYPEPIVQDAGWAPGPVWTGAENLAPPPTGIRSPDRPARRQIPESVMWLKKEQILFNRFLRARNLVFGFGFQQ
jgi:hypothetical protein